MIISYSIVLWKNCNVSLLLTCHWHTSGMHWILWPNWRHLYWVPPNSMITALPLMAQLSFSKHLQRRKFSAHFNLHDIPITTTWQFANQVASIIPTTATRQFTTCTFTTIFTRSSAPQLWHKVLLSTSPQVVLQAAAAPQGRAKIYSWAILVSFVFQINKLTKLFQQSFVWFLGYCMSWWYG